MEFFIGITAMIRVISARTVELITCDQQWKSKANGADAMAFPEKECRPRAGSTEGEGMILTVSIHISSMRDEKWFPRTVAIPVEKEADFREWAQRNHSQTVDVLNARGGMSPLEIWMAWNHRRSLNGITQMDQVDAFRLCVAPASYSPTPLTWSLLTPEQLRVHDLLPEEERRTQERIAAVVRERDERIAALEAQHAQDQAAITEFSQKLAALTAQQVRAIEAQDLARLVEEGVAQKMAAERERLCAPYYVMESAAKAPGEETGG